MKKVFFLSLLSISALFYSCNNEPVVNITSSSELLNLNALDGKQSLTISANSNWSAKSTDSWCTISDSTGTGSKELVVQTNDNLTGIARSTKITIKAGNQSKNVVINQSGGTIPFEDNFNDNSNSWIQDYDSITNTINNGYFDIKSKAKYYSYFVGTKPLIPSVFASYMITTKYKIISGFAPFGLTFGDKDSGNFYRILVYPQGGVLISKITNNVQATLINVGTKAITIENTISLVKNGENCTAYINDIKIGVFNYVPFGFYVGFYSCPQTEINVDYIKVVQF